MANVLPSADNANVLPKEDGEFGSKPESGSSSIVGPRCSHLFSPNSKTLTLAPSVSVPG